MEELLKNITVKFLLIVIGLGIWAIVLQNAGIIPSNQKVYVDGGHLSADVEGDVKVRGSVDVDNTVDINIEAINGHEDVFYNNPNRNENDKYYRIPVTPN
jgi:hypothetical protein